MVGNTRYRLTKTLKEEGTVMDTRRIYRSPRDIIWGRGSFSYLENIPGKRVLIVTDKVMTKMGVTARAKGYLQKGGLETRVFDEVEPRDPQLTPL